MLLQKQTKSLVNGERGNCLATALASLLSLDVTAVPQFEEMQKHQWKQALREWLSSIGRSIEFTKKAPKGYAIGVGRKLCGHLHAIIVKNGERYFDPSPSNEFYAENRYYIQVGWQSRLAPKIQCYMEDN